MAAKKNSWDSSIDYRQEPHRYRLGRGEQGVLTCQPYKSELLPLWRFKTEAFAKISAASITEKWSQYMRDNDFVGADLARKYLQMGFTRARRYARHKGGRKYDKVSGKELPVAAAEDQEKNAAAAVFKAAWDTVENDSEYSTLKLAWRKSEKSRSE